MNAKNNFKLRLIVFLTVLLSVFLVGMAARGAPARNVQDPMRETLDVMQLNEAAGDALANALQQRVDGGDTLVATSFVNLSNVEESSPLGQLISQQISTRLGQCGFHIAEVRLGQALRVDSKGEFLLSRDPHMLAGAVDAHAVLTGTYSAARHGVFVSARVLRLSDSAVIAAYEYVLPYTPDVRSLLRPADAQGGGAGAGFSLWAQYANRGKPVAKSKKTADSKEKSKIASSQSTQKIIPPMGPVSKRSSGGSGTDLSPLPERPQILPGGRMIDPHSPPTPLGKNK